MKELANIATNNNNNNVLLNQDNYTIISYMGKGPSISIIATSSTLPVYSCYSVGLQSYNNLCSILLENFS